MPSGDLSERPLNEKAPDRHSATGLKPGQLEDTPEPENNATST
jgi:hypothetical protein